jgi:hypothetical protein
MDLFPNSSKSVFRYVDPVLECSRTSRYAPLLCSVSPSQNSDFEGFERGPIYPAIEGLRVRRFNARFEQYMQLRARASMLLPSIFL